MISYKYRATDPSTGRKVSGVIDASSKGDASKILKAQGLAATSLEPTTGDGNYFERRKKRVKAKERVIYARQLATLINAGLPLVQSLRSVTTQTKSKQLKIVSTEIIANVEGGSTFADALARHPLIFNSIFINLVAAGEASGTLDAALERLADQQEKDAEIISKVRGALVYPLVVLFVMGLVVGFMIVGVLPQVKELYKGLGDASLPLITQILLYISDFIIDFWWLVALLAVFMVFLGSRWARTLGGKRLIDKFKMKAPAVGPLFMKMYMARYMRTGTTLIASGVPMLQVLDIVSKSVNNIHIEESINAAAEKVKGGKALSTAMTGDPSFLELVPQMVKIGEDSGAIEQMMGKTADYFEKEVDDQIKTVSTIIEPFLMIILGIVAITIVVAILLPIYSLVGTNIL